MRRLLSIIFILSLLAGFTVFGASQQYQRFLQTPLKITGSSRALVVERGASLRKLVNELERRGATQMDWRWRVLGRLKPTTIRTGEYALRHGMLPMDLLQLLASGKVISYRFTIVEGWNVQQLLSAMSADGVLVQTLHGADDLPGRAGLPEGNPEGWFLPETYVYERGDSDIELLQRAYRAMQKALAETWAGRADTLPYETANEMLVMASIIEKETSLPGERADIAGVLVRRLQKSWRLETDPTVIYGMGEAYQGNIRRQDLKKDTPYNTYTRQGLPPTPIALPGMASLQAAAHPALGEAMFFVADGKGGHTFSNSLDAHNAAVKRMLRKQQTDKSQTTTGKEEQKH